MFVVGIVVFSTRKIPPGIINSSLMLTPYSRSLFFVGSVAGIVEHLALYPVDTLKVSNTAQQYDFSYICLNLQTHLQAMRTS